MDSSIQCGPRAWLRAPRRRCDAKKPPAKQGSRKQQDSRSFLPRQGPRKQPRQLRESANLEGAPLSVLRFLFLLRGIEHTQQVLRVNNDGGWV
jgi:hypothetical protein